MTQLGQELGRRAHCGRAKCVGALLSNGGRVPIRAKVDAGGTRRAATHAQMVTVTARRRWEHSRPMRLVFTTCWATCGNGWRTARERRRKSAPSERYGEVVTGRRPWEMRASPVSPVGVIQRLDSASPAIAMLRARNSSGQRCRLGGVHRRSRKRTSRNNESGDDDYTLVGGQRSRTSDSNFVLQKSAITLSSS